MTKLTSFPRSLGIVPAGGEKRGRGGEEKGGAEGDLDDGKEATAYDEVRKLGWWRERWSQGGLMKSKVGALR